MILDSGPTKNQTINSSIKNTENGKFTLSEDDILKKSGEIVGKDYKFGSKGGDAYNGGGPLASNNNKFKNIDCSGLIWWTLKSLNVSVSLGQGTASTVPIDCVDWLTYSSSNTSYYYNEIGVWRNKDINDPKSEIIFDNNAGQGHKRVYDIITKGSNKLSVNGKGQDINVLKINDPITSNYRWYEYYDGETKKELPAGTIVVAYAGSKNSYDHSWITIGNLGTSDSNEAANILIGRGIITEQQRSYVRSKGSSKYWRIEASGSDGDVCIDNADENYSAAEGKNGIIKKIGPIWAFQVANYKEDKPATFNVLIDKVDEDGKPINGVTFTSWCKNDKNTSNLGKGNNLLSFNDPLIPYYQTVSYDIANGETKYIMIEETSVPTTTDPNKKYGRYNGYIIIKATRANNKTTLTLEDYPDVLVSNIRIDEGTVRFTMQNRYIDNDNTGYGVSVAKITDNLSVVNDTTYSTWYKINEMKDSTTITEKVRGERTQTGFGAYCFENDVHLNQTFKPNDYSVEDVYRFQEKSAVGCIVDTDIYEFKVKKTSGEIQDGQSKYYGRIEEITLTEYSGGTIASPQNVVTSQSMKVKYSNNNSDIEFDPKPMQSGKLLAIGNSLGNGTGVRVECGLLDSTFDGQNNLNFTIWQTDAETFGDYSLNVMKKSVDSKSYGDMNWDAIPGAKLNVKLYEDVFKDKQDFSFEKGKNESWDIETKEGKEALGEDTECSRTGISRRDTGESKYDIWKIDEATQPNGFLKLEKPLILGVEKNYNNDTGEFTIKKVFVYKYDNDSIKLDSQNKWEAQTVIDINKDDDNKSQACTEYTTYLYQDGDDQWNIVINGRKDEIYVTAKNTPEEEGNYNIKLTKKGIDGKQLGGVQFTVNATINGTEQSLYTTEKPLITDATNTVNIGNVVNITKDQLNTPDVYTIKEINVGENVRYPIGVAQDIKLNITKAMKNGEDGYSRIYYVSKIELTLDGANVTNESDTKSIAKVITEDNQEISVVAELDTTTNTITLTVENPVINGEFNLNLTKLRKNETNPIKGVVFDIKISDKNGNSLKNDQNEAISGKYTTNDEGKIPTINKIQIISRDDIYVTIHEDAPPEGYYPLSGDITFKVKPTYNSTKKSYELAEDTPTIENAKKVEVKTGEVLVEAENRVVTIHKGVKEVENQDSGYYNEITGDTYESAEDAKKVLHDWVINVPLDKGILASKVYQVEDTIDERLTYEGVASVKLKDKLDLAEDIDYKVNYNEETRLLTITFKDENMDFSDNIKNNTDETIEIRFNTKFATDEDGKIIGINQSIPNQATLVYGNNNRLNSETPEIHTGGVGIYKYDSTTNKALEGAHFKIATSKENAENKVFLKDTEGKDVEVVTDENGKAEFTGLEFGEDAMDNAKYKTIDETTGAEVYKYDWSKVETIYYIVETEAPGGYKLIEQPRKVVVKKDNYVMEDITSLLQVDNEQKVFDLALRKWVTQAIVTENGKTVVTETGHHAEDDPEEVVKVDLKKSKLNKVTVKFRYSIRVTNEGEVAGEAKEIRDDIPKGLKFVAEDNPDWREEYGQIVTDKLAGTTLQPGESAEVEIVLTWVNSEENMGVMVNTAEIEKDHNDFGIPDRDSTPGNNVPGEDDIDDAPVMITIKTGATDIAIYTSIALGALLIISVGGVVIKKKVVEQI